MRSGFAVWLRESSSYLPTSRKISLQSKEQTADFLKGVVVDFSNIPKIVISFVE